MFGTKYASCDRHFRHLCWWSVFLCSVTCITFVESQAWLTVLAVKKGNNDGNVYNLLTSSGPLNDVTGKEELLVRSIVGSGDFKSGLVDQWSSVGPTEVQIALYNEDGYMMWFARFQPSAGASKDPSTWMTTSSYMLSSDKGLNSAIANAKLEFNTTGMSMTIATTNNCRVQLTWNPAPQSYLYSTFSTVTPPPLSLIHAATPLPSTQTMVQTQYSSKTPIATFRFPYTEFTMFLGQTTYLVGIGLGRDLSVPGEISHLSVKIAMDPKCQSNYPNDDQYYTTVNETGTTNVKVFNAVYDTKADNSLALLWFDSPLAMYCLQLSNFVVTGTSHNTSLYVYRQDVNSVMEALTVAVQWWIDPTATTTTTTSVATSQTKPVTTSPCKMISVCEDSTTAARTMTTTQSSAINASQLAKVKDEIQQTLGIVKEETTKYKRQFISVPDSRTSALVIGIIGISFIAVAIFGIIALDFTTIRSQLSIMQNNLRHGLHLKQKPSRVSGKRATSVEAWMPASSSSK